MEEEQGVVDTGRVIDVSGRGMKIPRVQKKKSDTVPGQ